MRCGAACAQHTGLYACAALSLCSRLSITDAASVLPTVPPHRLLTAAAAEKEREVTKSRVSYCSAVCPTCTHQSCTAVSVAQPVPQCGCLLCHCRVCTSCMLSRMETHRLMSVKLGRVGSCGASTRHGTEQQHRNEQRHGRQKSSMLFCRCSCW
jgi:hypothetical protein